MNAKECMIEADKLLQKWSCYSIENRRYIGQDKTMWSSSWDLCNGSMIVASYGKEKYVSKEFELIIKNKTSDDVSNFLIEALIEKIKKMIPDNVKNKVILKSVLK